MNPAANVPGSPPPEPAAAGTGPVDAPAAPARCANCGAILQGDFCHRCGQSVHNPIRHARHAIEELFESLWHLDGRVFRTLRDLLVPARVACGYLAGHRARYIAPLRLFVVLSVLTFFIGQMTVDFGNDAIQIDGADESIATAGTVAEVERRRDAALARLARARESVGPVPVVASSMQAAQDAVREQAAARIAELQSNSDPIPAATEPATAERAAADAPKLRFGRGEPWDAQRNPVALRWLPAAANDWLNHKIDRALTNAPRLEYDEDLRRQVVLGSVPTALFVLMPVFALLLKLAYLGSGRLYLEHLVVALYSHAALLLALLGIFLLVGLEQAVVPHAPGSARLFGWLEAALWWAMPVYLLIMQKRIYAQSWGVTVLKYGALGSVYVMLVAFAAVMAGFAGLAKL